MNGNEIQVDPKIVRQLEFRIIFDIKTNLSTKIHSDPEMVKRIQKVIEEELKCYSNT